MGFARASAAAGVVDGMIYVFGGCEKPNWVVEVFDPKTQTWDALSLNQPPPPPDDMNSLMHESGVIEEKDKTKKIFGLNEKGNGLLYIRHMENREFRYQRT